MDANGYETFEYLQSDNVEDSEQLYVLQDNGTFLSINRPVEFVTQVQNVEDVLEEVQPIYDVAPQQFYVDVNSSSELITVPDEFIIPTEGNNIYSNNFLLQQASNSSEVQIPQNVNPISEDVVEQLILPEISVPMDVNINDSIESDSLQINGCTEITITDEQYQLLEKKGWIMLETNDKTYLIDNLGLHDITNNNQLIRKLGAELTNGNTTSFTEPITSNAIETKIALNGGVQNIKTEQTLVPYVPENGEPMNLESIDIQCYPSVEEDPEDLPISETKKVPDLMPLEKAFLETTVNELSEKYEKSDPRINYNTIKIKTKFSLSEIPPEIILGSTVKGKRLVARISKRKDPEVSTESAGQNGVSQKRKPKAYPTMSAFHPKIEKLIQQAVRGNISPLSEDEVVVNTDKVIQQLLRVPAFKPAVIERKLIITKIVLMENKHQTSSQESDPIIITGRVIKQSENKWGFHYIPNMLSDIRQNKANDNGSAEKKLLYGGDIDVTFLQIHIQEVKSPDGIARISITLNRRVIFLKSKKLMESCKVDEKQPKLQTVYACTSCAAVFKTAYRLRCHQKTHKMDFDFDSLITINSKNSMNPFNMVDNGSKKEYICNQCQHKTTKISMMLRHIKSHFKSTSEETCEEDLNDKREIYKCKMCSINFLYASTLSKHILSKHIKVS